MSLNMTWTIVVCNACVGDEINWMAGGGVKRDDAPSMCVCVLPFYVWERSLALTRSPALEMSLVYRISVVAKKSCFMPSHWFFYWPCWLPGLKKFAMWSEWRRNKRALPPTRVTLLTICFYQQRQLSHYDYPSNIHALIVVSWDNEMDYRWGRQGFNSLLKLLRCSLKSLGLEEK